MRIDPFRIGMLLACLATAPLAHADNIWCVNNTASFEQALESARDDDTTIKLVRGEYLTFDVDLFDIDHSLTVLGGYSDGSCSEAGRSLDPALTVFRPFTIGGAYGFHLNWIKGDLLLKSITLRGYGLGFQVSSATDLLGADKHWTFDRVRIEGSGGLSQNGLLREAFRASTNGNADLTLRQVVIADNAAGEDCSAIAYAGNDDLIVQQSTFARNAGTGLCAFGNGGSVDIDNNIFWGSACGLRVEDVPAADLHLRHNTIDCNDFEELPSVNVGNDSLDPQFTDPANGDYRLLVTSPAVDAGINPPTGGLPGSDITGGPRVIGAGVDRGPWETDQSSATVLVVSNASNDGPGSLYAAIDQSNTLPGVQIIRFNIPGTCPRIIALTTNLPDISDSVRIEGYSQPASVPGTAGAPTICVGLWGNQTLDYLLQVLTNGDATSIHVSGLGLGGTSFDAGAAAIRLANGFGHEIVGNQFGGSIGPAGNPVALNALQHGVVVTLWAHDVYIGGDDAVQRNYFNSSNSNAINISATAFHPAGVRVTNNFIGPKPNGLAADANAIGIGLNQTDGNLVINNWISGNAQDGVVIFGPNAHHNTILNNHIGRCPGCLASPAGEALMGNGSHGVRIQGGAHDNTVALNRIAGNGGTGIVETDNGLNNRFVSNRIYRNATLGIDIDGDGVTPNNSSIQTGDGVQNFPLIGTAGGGFYNGTAVGSLNAAPNRDYTIQLFQSDACDGSGHGEGGRLVGAGSVTTPAAPLPGFYSTVPFSLAVQSTGLDGKAITAIAIDADGNTSEFSPCRTYVYSDVIFTDGFEPELP